MSTEPTDETIYPETIEALKAMKEIIVLPPDEQKRRIEEIIKAMEEDD